MAEEKRNEKKDKKNKTSSTVKKDKKKSSDAHEQTSTAAKPTLLADENAVDSKLSSLFAVKPVLKKAVPPPVETTQVADDDEDMIDGSETLEERPTTTTETSSKNKKRKRRDDTDDLEDNYLRKVAKQSEQEVEELKRDNKAVLPIGQSASEHEIESAQEEETGAVEVDSDDDEHYVPPQHETQTGASPELEKANRTIFIGNVAAEAVTSKSARKALEEHLKSFFDKIPKVTEEEKKAFKLESVRFRSTPFDPKLPKKAAFARGEVMTTTVQSTNAYAVYSTQALAREACRRLNATIVLDRHIRVDSVAHPAPVAHKRCVFVGNLGFVNDETNINAAKEEAGKKLKERKPADIEEGLWRLFGKHGTVESVRVVRDSKTRVGIGIAYVQFTDDIAVESALTEDGKASPPMLPRKLRVTRARAMKRSRPTDKSRAPEKAEGYKRKVTHGESTLNGRLGKLMGKAAASKAKKDPKTAALVKRPEDFVFEGHRASSKEKNTGMKFNKKVKKAKPTGRAAKRTAAFKSGSLKRAGRG